MTFNPEGFADMKDKYFLLKRAQLSGHGVRGSVADAVGRRREPFLAASPAIINITAGQRALLRISDLDVSSTRHWRRWEFRCR